VVYSSEGHIYTYDVELGTTPVPLTVEGNNTRPVFSPDGTQVAFSSVRNGTDGVDLWVKTLDDDAPARSIIRLEGDQRLTQWPLDTLLVFEQRPNPSDLWMVNLSDPDSATAEVYLPLEADLDHIKVSPDGTLAAYTSDESGREEVYIRSFPDPGEGTLVSEGLAEYPFWSPDGDIVYYWRDDGPVSTFMAVRIQRGPTPGVLSRDSLFTGAYNRIRSDLHPGGDRVVVAQDVGTASALEGAPEPGRFIMVTNFFEELRQRLGN
jgi:Tol biopolymer transport system component